MYKKQVQNFLEKESDKPKIVIIFGPTASGKTDMSIEIAKYLDTEIISTDSRQIFKYMDIGTGKITPDEMQWVKHHMLDVINPDESFSLWDFKYQAEWIISRLQEKSKIPMLVGGTGLYIESLIYDFSLPKVPADETIRKRLSKLSNEELHQKLQEIDPEYACELHPNNRHYVERAIEVKMLTWKSKTEFREDKIPKYDILLLYPQMPEGHDIFSLKYRQWLYDRINLRVEKMFENGAEKELKKLIDMWYGENDFWMNSIGYREFFLYFRWEINRGELIEKVQQNSRNYAKRQITWFRKYKDLL